MPGARGTDLAELHGLEADDREKAGRYRAFTLPLFDPATEPQRALTPRHRRPSLSSPREQALHIYWSAGLEGHALGSLALATPHPDERRALRELQGLEYEVKEAAARLLRDVWQLHLPRATRDEEWLTESAA